MIVTKYGIDADGDIWWKVNDDTNRLICANTELAARLIIRWGASGCDLAYITENYGPIKEI